MKRLGIGLLIAALMAVVIWGLIDMKIHQIDAAYQRGLADAVHITDSKLMLDSFGNLVHEFDIYITHSDGAVDTFTVRR